MNELLDKVEIDESFYIYLQRNSSVWLCRFKVGNKWISRTTKQRDKSKAVLAAVRVKTECEIKVANGIAISTKAFRDVAELAIQRMHDAPEGSKGQGSFKNYELFLRRYHIPFFDRTHITSIDRAKILEFENRRAAEVKRMPTKSTVKSHNVALQRVFDEAVLRGWMNAALVPPLGTASGVAGKRRDYFTVEEVQKITAAFPDFIASGRASHSRDIRELLFFYFQFAIFTGLRPGTEIDNLKWSDIQIVGKGAKRHIVINVRKGKTTLHTGARKVVAYGQVLELILDMSARSNDGEDSDEGVPDDWDPLVFRLPNGETTDQLGRNFTMLLRKLKLENGPGGKRTLYSLRHTYITMKLLEGNKPEVIAKQCGTSTAMIETFYNHLTSLMYTKELIGNEGSEMNKLVGQYSDIV